MRNTHYLIVCLAAFSIFVIETAMPMVMTYMSFYYGLRWEPFLALAFLGLSLRLTFLGTGLCIGAFSVWRLVKRRRVLEVALVLIVGGIALMIILGALREERWRAWPEEYLRGLATRVESDSFVWEGLQEIRDKTRSLLAQGKGGELPEAAVPGAIMSLNQGNFNGVFYDASGCRLLWGNRVSGGWGIKLAEDARRGPNSLVRQVDAGVFVIFIFPF